MIKTHHILNLVKSVEDGNPISKKIMKDCQNEKRLSEQI